MEFVCLDLEGVLVPEIWSKVAEFTGEEKFNLTTQEVKDYSLLMDMRVELVNLTGLTMKDINLVVDKMEPLEGAKEFVDWVRDNFQLAIVSDSFYQLAWPLIRKLGTPSIICHHLDIDRDKLRGYKLRHKENKKRVGQSLKAIDYRVFDDGDCFNVIQKR